MNIRRLVSIFAVGLSFCAAAQANQTPANDDGGGNVVYFDRHALNCGNQGMTSMRLFRPQPWQIAFDYQCRNSGDTTSTDRYTPPNDDGAGNAVFLDRHGIDCQNYALQYVQLYRPSSNQIAYHYRCGEKPLENVTDHYTPANDDGAGNSVFLDRHNVACPDNKVLSYMRLFRPSGNTISYHYKCGTPYTDSWKEYKSGGLCLDGSLSQYDDRVYFGTCHGGDNQKWKIDGQGLMRLRSNSNLCVQSVYEDFNFFFIGDYARLRNCDANVSSQVFNYSGSKLYSTVNNGQRCLSRPFNTNNAKYDTCSNWFGQQIEANAGSTLQNVDAFAYLNHYINHSTTQAFINALQVDEFQVVQIDPVGNSIITGRIRNMNNGNPLGKVIEAAVGMRKYLFNDTRNDIPVTITVAYQGNYDYKTEVRLELVRGWRELVKDSVLGTELIFKDADLVLNAVLINGELSKSVGIDGAVYIKPTNNDSWLFANPSVTRDIGADPTTSFGLVIKGACSYRPNQATNGESECGYNWNMFGAGIITAFSEANGGYNYLQVDTVGGQPVGGKVEFTYGTFLDTAVVSGYWAVSEDGSQGRLHTQLNGLDQQVKDTLRYYDVTGSIDALGLMDSFSVKEVFIEHEPNQPTRFHVIADVLGEEIEIVQTPQYGAYGVVSTAQANQDLIKAMAEAIWRVLANKTQLTKVIQIIDTGLQVFGIRGGTTVVFETAGSLVNLAGDTVNDVGEVITGAAESVGDWFCSWLC